MSMLKDPSMANALQVASAAGHETAAQMLLDVEAERGDRSSDFTSVCM